MRVEVTVTGSYELPDDLEQLLKRYGTNDTHEVLAIDLENAQGDLESLFWLLEGIQVCLQSGEVTLKGDIPDGN